MYPVTIQLVFWSCSNWLPMDAYVDVMMVVSIAAKKIPMIIGVIYIEVSMVEGRSDEGECECVPRGMFGVFDT